MPAPYIVKLIACELVVDKEALTTVSDNKGNVFYYDDSAGYVMDMKVLRHMLTKNYLVLKEKI